MDFKEFNYDNFSLIDCISLLQSVLNSPHAYSQNKAFTKHIVDALMQSYDFDDCSLNLHLADSTIKKPMGRINDVLIVANRNYVPVDFIVLDIDCNPSCPIILGRPFLRMIGAIIDMKEGHIKFQFPLRKGMEHFPRLWIAYQR